MPQVLSILTLLAIGAGSYATDIRLYEDNAHCRGPYVQCPNIPAGECCFGGDLYESCAAVNPQHVVIAYARQNGELCGVVLGRDNICYSAPNGIASISGAKWATGSTKRSEEDLACDGQGVKDDLACSGHGVNATELGVDSEGKTYIISMNRPEFSQYLQLSSITDRQAFIIGNADKVVDTPTD